MSSPSDAGDFWEDVAPFLFSPSRWTAAVREVDQAIALTGLTAGARVLDMPCGPGRHALAFAHRGMSVTGVDRTGAFLADAQRRAGQEKLSLEWVRADMREFQRPNTFDLVVNLFTSFGYFKGPDDNRRVAERFFDNLRPGGRLLMDLMSKEILARTFRPRDWQEDEQGTLLLEERRLAEDWGWIEVRWIVVGHDTRREHRFGHHLYAATELVDLLAGVGFGPISVFGNLDGAPYDQEAERLVILAKKPA